MVTTFDFTKIPLDQQSGQIFGRSSPERAVFYEP
jgi:hypothetical protein